MGNYIQFFEILQVLLALAVLEKQMRHNRQVATHEANAGIEPIKWVSSAYRSHIRL
jgi:hypothetical protein